MDLNKVLKVLVKSQRKVLQNSIRDCNYNFNTTDCRYCNNYKECQEIDDILWDF